MFQVLSKNNTDVIYEVYAVKETKSGALMFLIFVLNRWTWVNAEDYVPRD